MSTAAVRPQVASFSSWLNRRMVVLPEPAGPERKTVLDIRSDCPTETIAHVRQVRAAAKIVIVRRVTWAVDSVDIRPMRWTARRGRLESLAKNWRPPRDLWRQTLAQGNTGKVGKLATDLIWPPVVRDGRRRWAA